MTESAQLSVLATAQPGAFVPIGDKETALAFYRDTLGLAFVDDQSPFALVFRLGGEAHGILLRATFAGEFKPQPFTVLGWHVDDIAAAVTALTEAGVAFNNYPWTGGSIIWTAPGGAQIAWFNDPFGNVLSLAQFP